MKLNKILSALAGAVLSVGVVSGAAAAGVYQVTPAGIGVAGYAPFTADFVQGNSSLYATATSATTATGTGWINFTGFSLAGNPVFGTTSGLGQGAAGYQLYIVYSESSTLTGGTMNSPGSSATLTSLTYTIYANPASDAKFIQANATTSTSATVTPGAKTITLGSGHLITGVAGIDSAGGAFFNSTETLTLTADGSKFFTDPIPFFNLAFSEFNNSGQRGNVLVNGTHISIDNESGGIDMNTPEPGSLPLLGIGLVSLGLAWRNKFA